jgi:hypothetical protein
MAKAKQPSGEPMTLGNMRQLGVHRLIALTPSCRHSALIDVSKYASEVEVPWFRMRPTPYGLAHSFPSLRLRVTCLCHLIRGSTSASGRRAAGCLTS